MPKLLLSKIWIYELKDIPQNRTQRRRQKKDIQCILKTPFFKIFLSQEDNRKIQPTLETLKDERCLAAFRAFLQSEFSEENIEFWLACRDYSRTTSPADLSWKQQRSTRSSSIPRPRERSINVDHHIHEKINRYMKAPGLCCFDEAVRHMYKLMESDSYSRFLRSDTYLGLRRKARTFWSRLGVKSL
uniref:Regulator of G protein signaling 1 n=1 Tax=Salmo trutta TaxID=8032 RepID=A0A673Y3W7_SALTR